MKAAGGGGRDSPLKTVHQSLQQYIKSNYPSTTAQTSQFKSPLASANIIFSISPSKLLHCHASLSVTASGTRGQPAKMPVAHPQHAWQSPVQKLK